MITKYVASSSTLKNHWRAIYITKKKPIKKINNPISILCITKTKPEVKKKAPILTKKGHGLFLTK